MCSTQCSRLLSCSTSEIAYELRLSHPWRHPLWDYETDLLHRRELAWLLPVHSAPRSFSCGFAQVVS